MNWKRRNSIQKLVDGILDFNVLRKSLIELIDDIIKNEILYLKNIMKLILNFVAYTLK